MNKNFRKTSIATLMSMALLTVFSSQSIAAVGDPVHSGLEEEYGALAIGIGSHAKGFNAVAIGASSKAGYVSGEGDSEVHQSGGEGSSYVGVGRECDAQDHSWHGKESPYLLVCEGCGKGV